MHVGMVWWFYLILLVQIKAQNLVKNAELESTSSWDCWGIHCEVTNDHASGQHAVKVTGRQQEYEGPSQFINVQPNSHYSVTGIVKILNDYPGELGQKIGIGVEFTYTDGRKDYLGAASLPLINSHSGFVHLKGDFVSPSKPLKATRIYYNGPKPSINFIVDATTVNHIPTNTNWRTQSDHTINTLRKSNINFHINVDGGIDPSQVQIEIKQTKKSFAFGTAVACDEYMYGHQQYKDFLNKHFNWVTTEGALKWPSMEGTQGNIKYDLPVNTIKELRKHGIKVRAHNIIWSVPTFIQSWVKALSGSALRQAVSQRITGVMSKVKGLVEHWDVNNEDLHSQWYQNRLSDANYNVEVFQQAHKTDPSVKLFLNDYNVVAQGEFTQAYLKQALHVKGSNSGLYGIGVQGHFSDEMRPDPTAIKARLDVLAQANLPIWITELDVMAADENTRADYYETALRSLYGHPAVEGIVFWGFWSPRHWRGVKGAILNAGFTVNAAGRRVLDLLENQWMTHETRKITKIGTNYFTVKGFHGDYQVKVMYQGRELTDQRKSFNLGKSDQNINIHVHK
ncbi:hypothetical protein SNE40_010735 [Patella caerulea]|uniref:GH10 domain-containing protein n=1 Tax=Patella caerulea TaxID=87958 RepID=A0AAN8Q5E2_PATCE